MVIENSMPNPASAKAAHVNLMTDTIIANLPPEALRSIVRGLLGIDPKVTPAFLDLASKYLATTKPNSTPKLFTDDSMSPRILPAWDGFRRRYRCLMGCGQGFETLRELTDVIEQVHGMNWDSSPAEVGKFLAVLANIDSDVVQAVTAVQKELTTSAGIRLMSDSEIQALNKLTNVLFKFKEDVETLGEDFPFQRGLSRLEMLQGRAAPEFAHPQIKATVKAFTSTTSSLKSIKLGDVLVPRMFMGLWQFSSPAWGSASRSKINVDFRKHVNSGLVAYDMADHYGDAEVTFGQFRSSQPDANNIYCATKWCVFESITVTPEVVESSVTERLTNINSAGVELLQFHWQDYGDQQYVQAAKLVEQDRRVRSLGLCNFDTIHMDEILESGVKVVSNQVQFSLIDLRPTFKMADSCRKHNVKLLTYGSLCGGLLASKWLGKPAPNLFDEYMTPSHRKYLEMIMAWGGWELFQELHSVLATIGHKYNVALSIVAIRWVLDHDYVAAVIIGARMGISEHIEENLKVFSFKLDEEDQRNIQKVLDKCRAREVFEAMGDCGSEYRQ